MTPEQENTAAFGGRYAMVHTAAGTSEPVHVRQLTIRQMPMLLDCVDDEARTVELYCDRPKGWADTLTMESVEQLLKLGEEVNEGPFVSWLRRRLDRQSRVQGPVSESVARSVAALAEKLAVKSASADTSPASPQPVA